MFANYTYQRNEPVLLHHLGLEKPENRRAEKQFLDALFTSSVMESSSGIATQSSFALPNCPTLIVVMGGFMDGNHGFAYSICAVLRDLIKDRVPYHLFYREHDEANDVRHLVNFYARHGCKVIIIGHSWGGSSSIMRVAAKVTVPIQLMISLDPVGFFRPRGKLSHVRRWVNVYVDYQKANYARHNNVARLGLPWEHCVMADVNVLYRFLKHHKALDMFSDYCVDDFNRALLFD